MNITRPDSPTHELTFFHRIKKKLMYWIRLTDKPVVKVYHGYGTQQQMFVFGHVFTLCPVPRKKYTRNIWTNTLALLRLFIVKPEKDATLELIVEDKVLQKRTESDGFFRFDWKPVKHMEAGWHEVKISLLKIGKREIKGNITGTGHVFVPHSNQYACISDIDDTFLISHSSNLRKRLFVLFTENAHSRKPFDGVVKHYQLLANAATLPDELNPFFYVSSSEWNLYDYIDEFSRRNDLPPGIYLLSQIKTFSEIWKTGQNRHATKFMRIARVLEAYPNQLFILLGDDSQQDPVIYASVVEHFSKQIKAVYLRNVYEKNMTIVKGAIQKIEAAGISCCHFKHSAEAIEHSLKIGLVSEKI